MSWSEVVRRLVPGRLVEYGTSPTPLSLAFEFNPSQISRSRRVSIQTGDAQGARGGYDFHAPNETARASQGVQVEPESFSFTILLDATDRMNVGEVTACTFGVQPEIDILRSMVEPKSQTPAGAQTLAALGAGVPAAFSRHQYSSVLLFIWGPQVLPVFLTGVDLTIKDFMPTLVPYRAEAALTLQVIESENPFYDFELQRQFAAARAFSVAGANRSPLVFDL